MSGHHMGNSKDCHPTLIPFQPMSLSGSTRTEGMQALEKETKQKRKTREAEMRLILGLPATGLASLVQTQFIFYSHPSPAVTTCVTVLSRKYQPDQPCYLYFSEDFPGKFCKLDLYSSVVCHPKGRPTSQSSKRVVLCSAIPTPWAIHDEIAIRIGS